MPSGDHTYVGAGLIAQLRTLVHDAAYQRYQDTLCLIALHQVHALLRGGSRSQDNSYARDVAGYQRHAQLTDDSIRQMAVAGFLIGLRPVDVFQNFNELGAQRGSYTGHERVIQTFFPGHQGLYHTQGILQFTQGRHLGAGDCVIAGQAVCRSRESYCLIGAVLCDGVVNSAFGQAVYGIISTKYNIK